MVEVIKQIHLEAGVHSGTIRTARSQLYFSTLCMEAGIPCPTALADAKKAVDILVPVGLGIVNEFILMQHFPAL